MVAQVVALHVDDVDVFLPHGAALFFRLQQLLDDVLFFRNAPLPQGAELDEQHQHHAEHIEKHQQFVVCEHVQPVHEVFAEHGEDGDGGEQQHGHVVDVQVAVFIEPLHDEEVGERVYEGEQRPRDQVKGEGAAVDADDGGDEVAQIEGEVLQGVGYEADEQHPLEGHVQQKPHQKHRPAEDEQHPHQRVPVVGVEPRQQQVEQQPENKAQGEAAALGLPADEQHLRQYDLHGKEHVEGPDIVEKGFDGGHIAISLPDSGSRLPKTPFCARARRAAARCRPRRRRFRGATGSAG